MFLKSYFIGCQVDLWKDYNENGNHYTCPGYEYGHWYQKNDLGTVGNDNASTIKCTCPVDFDRIVYDTPHNDWALDLDPNSGIQLNLQTVQNSCNPARDTNFEIKSISRVDVKLRVIFMVSVSLIKHIANAQTLLNNGHIQQH